MLFKKKLKGFGVETPMGDALGKVDDLLLDIKTWKVSKLVVSPGALKKDVTYDLTAISKFDEDGKKIIISPKVEPGEIPEFPSHAGILLTDLMDKKVMTSDEEKLKGMYDIDIATKLKTWEIWKMLIQTPIKERRLRISPKDVEEVAETIALKLSMEEIEKREEGEEEG